MSKLKTALASSFAVLIALTLLLVGFSQAKACNGNNMGKWKKYLFYDDFVGRTFFKDEKSWAQWYRYEYNLDGAASYVKLPRASALRLMVDEKATDVYYSNADISTSEINNYQGRFLFGENTKVSVRMRYSPNINADPATPAGAKGSAGLLFWNYFLGPVDPELKDLTKVRDAFGFVWQDEGSVPTPGFWEIAVAQGVPGEYLPDYDVDLSQYHVYSLERRHDSMKYFIDGQLVHTVLLNQPGGLDLPATSKLSVDMWVDNATYVLDFSTFQIDMNFNHLDESQYIDIDYVKVTRL
ncbi:hypothetical protein JW796_02890 [Candidatus Dojkabacteria bacterium]|nr:hypothetical protein [Candidatus Dojkabacteria bacterium]